MKWETRIDPDPPICGARRGGPRSQTFCELPPDHMTGRATDTVMWEYDHAGRTPSGRWYSWPPQTPPGGVMRCDVCGLPDSYRGLGDGIGSCDCPRCDCGEAKWSVFCDCPDYDADDYGSDYDLDLCQPGEPARDIVTVEIPGVSQ